MRRLGGGNKPVKDKKKRLGKLARHHADLT